jgi:peroxiredoxin Q/BCP
MALPKVGNKAPAFNLVNQDGEKVSLKDFAGKKECSSLFLSKSNDTRLYGTGMWHS